MTSLTRLSLANRLIVGLVTLAIVIFGVLATQSLRQELLPSTQVPTASVTAVYPGASPEIVAEEVATPLGQAISGVAGVTAVRSTSINGVANLTVEWDYGLDSDDVATDIRSAADSVADLPDQTEVEVLAFSTDDIPVQVLAVASDAPLTELAQRVNDIAIPQLSEVEGVRQVQLTGENVTELAVRLRPAELRKYDIAAAAVTQAVRAQALVVPAGTSFDRSTELAIQVGDTPTAAKQVAGWPIPAPDGPVTLGTLAEVKVQSVAATTLARADGRAALSLNVLKEADADAVEISGAIDDLLPGLEETLEANTSLATVFDQAPAIEKSIEDLAVEGALGLAFAVLIILVFLLSLRSTIITAISIPLSLLVALIGLQVGDYSLNIFTLAALTVAVGRVVDDSIVVVENIKRRDTGPVLTPEAIVASVREVAGAVTASTLTTVAVFLPVAIVSGVTGELFRPFSITVAIALGASLLVSLTVVPVLAYWFLRSPKRRREAAATESEAREKVTRLQGGYLPLLGLALRRPVLTLLAAAVIFAGTMASATLLKTDFIGSFTDRSTLQIDTELPVGTRLSATSAATQKIESVLQSKPEISGYLAQVGTGGTNNASIFVNLSDEERYDALLADLQSTFAETRGIGKVTVGQPNRSGASNDISITVTGDEDQALRTAAEQVQALVESTNGLADVRSDLTDQRPVLKVEVDRTKAAAQGFTQSEIGQAISEASRGTEVGTILLNGETRDIMVRPQATGDDSPTQIAGLELPVSQLQQQQAVDAATDRLEKKRNKLEDRQEELSDQQDGLGDRQEEIGDRQAALGDRQQAAAEKQADDAADAARDQIAELRDRRTEARRDLADVRQQLADLRNSAPPAPAPGQPGVPVTQAQQAAQQYQQQVAQLEAAVEQSEAGLEQLDKQIEAAVEQQSQGADQREQQDGFTDEQEDLGNAQDGLAEDQKRLTEAQSDLAKDQADLAEEQQDIADVRAKPIRVRDVAKVKAVLEASTVTQIDGIGAVTVTATPDAADLGAITSTLESELGTLDLPPGTSAELGGASSEQQDAFRQLGLAMLLAIVIVFLIMVATFRSLIQPLILLTSIPFAATGAVAGLLITDIPLGVPAMVGLLMLIGIVVTNAIVLIDLINKLRARGENLSPAVTHGARLRLRPIIMTATATIFALIPMGLGLTGGGAFISQPLAVVVIGGLVSSTVLTLVLVPVLYTLAERRGERKRLRRGALAEPDQGSASPPPPLTDPRTVSR